MRSLRPLRTRLRSSPRRRSRPRSTPRALRRSRASTMARSGVRCPYPRPRRPAGARRPQRLRRRRRSHRRRARTARPAPPALRRSPRRGPRHASARRCGAKEARCSRSVRPSQPAHPGRSRCSAKSDNDASCCAMETWSPPRRRSRRRASRRSSSSAGTSRGTRRCVLRGKVPLSGRHAGAALVAHGHLAQDDLWPVLRAHAEWTIARALSEPRGTTRFEDEPPARLRAEPSVFGGATGAEVLVEILRRAVPPELALTRLGGEHARFAEGPRAALLSECALAEDVCDLVRAAAGWSVGEVLSASDPELAPVLHALVALGVLEVLASLSGAEPKSARVADPLDEEAFRERVRARLALVEEGDYFALLGVARGATSYEIRRAYVELRRALRARSRAHRAHGRSARRAASAARGARRGVRHPARRAPTGALSARHRGTAAARLRLTSPRASFRGARGCLPSTRWRGAASAPRPPWRGPSSSRTALSARS
jgi:hypothetical protein